MIRHMPNIHTALRFPFSHATSTLIVFMILLTLVVMPATAQTNAPITLNVSVGFEGRFREGEWMPVWVDVTNESDDFSGRLVVRPETSGEGIPNTFSVPVTLARGARQTVPLYIAARSFATQVRVELMDDDGVVYASQSAPISAIQPQDRLYAVISDTLTGTVDMAGARFNGGEVTQIAWTMDDIPPYAEAMRSLDVLLINDADTTPLTGDQRRALEDWIAGGGQLIVSGGANWQATAEGVRDLLPLNPTRSETTESLAPLADWLALPETASSALASENNIIIAAGDLTPDAQTLVALDDGTPLIARKTLGGGTVDYIAADPNTQPLRDWAGMSELWFTLQASTLPQPGWSHGFGDWSQAARAAEILPGVESTPDALPLLLFFGLYIALISPINFLILRRINRLEWAWGTIPVCILAFTVAAWALGYSLRGNEAILNRLALVQAWTDSERARADGLVGVLSPRRTQYTLSGEVGDLLRPVALPVIAGGSNLLARGAGTSMNIVQTSDFAAEDFAVDASYIANFALGGVTEKPAISGSASMSYDPNIGGQMVVRGSVQNNTDMTLHDPTILVRGAALHLGVDLAPGDLETFEMILTGETAHGAPVPYLPTIQSLYLTFRSNAAVGAAETSVQDIIGENYTLNPLTLFPTDEDLALWREQFFLWSLVDDSYLATGRGDQVFVSGWLDNAPLTVELDGADWSDQVTTLVIAELETDVERPANTDVTITPDRFSWTIREADGSGDLAPVNLTLQLDEQVVYRFTPLPDAVLNEVDALTIVLDDMSVSSRRVPMAIWNWREETWEELDVNRDGLTLDDPEPYLGPQNSVQLQLIANDIGGYLRIGRLGVEQRGRF